MKLRLLSAAFVAVLVAGIAANAQFRPSATVETSGVAVASLQKAAGAETISAAGVVAEMQRQQQEAATAAAAEQARLAAVAAKQAANARKKLAAAQVKRASRGAPRAPRGGGTPVQVSGDLLDRLAACESGMNPQKNTGNGFYGAFQFMPRTWWSLAMGGKYDERAAIANVLSASYATQKNIVATKIPVSSWHNQFPGCSRKLGIR